MRYIALLFTLILLAGCGSSNATPAPTATTVAAASQGARQWSQPPKMTINKNHNYTATVTVSSDAVHGSFVIQLLPKVAPLTVNNFVFLARRHFYDDVIFHRIIKGFMVQTGDPTGTGTGGPGYTFADEKVTLPYLRGTVAMANSGPNTNGSQFFIIVAPKSYPLPKSYTIFGRVIKGMNVVQQVADVPVTMAPNGVDQVASQPITEIRMQKVTIH